MKYIGRRTCQCEIKDDDYLGSGTFLKQAINKYGIDNFEKIILYECNSFNECVNKEIEVISMLDAVNNKEYYNVAPGGLSRPDGFVMSDNEKNKMEYLKNMMDNEAIYGVKIEDDERRNVGDIPRIMFGKIAYNNEGKAIFYLHLVSDDTKKIKKDADKYAGSITTMSKVPQQLKYGGVEKWLQNSNYMLVPKAIYDKYRSMAIEDACSFKIVSEEITKNHEIYFDNLFKDRRKQNISTKNTTEQVNFKKSSRSEALNCIINLSAKSKDYYNILELVNKYSDLGFAAVFHAATGNGSVVVGNISNGSLKCSDKQKIIASRALDYERRFVDFQIRGRRDYFNIALEFCYHCDEVDNEELYRRIKRKCDKKQMPIIRSIEQAISEIERIYNYRNNNKIHITQKYLTQKTRW